MHQPLTRHWVERELTPYLRYAFSHELAYDEDIWPKIHAAIDFCMTKRDHPNDGDELILERICHAVAFRYKDLAPELRFVTDNLESLARWLVRHAQVHGPYELLGRMNIGSGAWREYEAARLEHLKMEVKKERDNRLFLTPPPPPKAVPSEDQIDPRLVLAMPGQYVGSHLDGTLQVHVDQYFREQIRRARDPQQTRPIPPSWVQQAQQASGANQSQLYLDQNTGFRWSPQQQLQQYYSSGQTQAPSYIRHLGQRQSPYVPQGVSSNAFNGLNMPTNGSPRMGMMSQAPNTTAGAPHVSGGWQSNMPANFQAPPQPLPPQQRMQHFPVQPPAAPYAQPTSTRAGIPMGDIAHLRGKDWSNAAEQRAREFRLNGVTGLNLHQHQNQPSFNTNPPASMYPVPNTSTQPSSLATNPLDNGIIAPLPDHIVIPHAPQPHQQPQEVEMQDRHESGGSQFVNHPGFSNVTNAYQNWQYGPPMNPPPGQNRNLWG